MAVGSREMDPNDLKERDLYVDECCSQILSQKGVQHVIVMNENHDPIKSTLPSGQDSLDYTGLYGSLVFKAQRAMRLLRIGDLLEVRVHTRKHEAILTPDDKLVFITVQKPVDLYETVK